MILYNPAISRTSPDEFPPPPNIPHYPALSRTIPTILSNFDISGTPTIPTISPVAGRAEYHSPPPPAHTLTTSFHFRSLDPIQDRLVGQELIIVDIKLRWR